MTKNLALPNYFELCYENGKKRCIEIAQIVSFSLDTTLHTLTLFIEVCGRGDGQYESTYRPKEQYNNLKKLLNAKPLLEIEND